MLDQNTAWVKKYQPMSIEDYVFNNDQQKQIINNWINNEKIDGNLILYGPPGTGKTTLIEILIRKIIKTQADLYRIKSRSVEEIDKLQSWVSKSPTRSKHNIVYIEEIDKLSKQAMVTLKDGLLEKYVNTCIFLCATNHPKRIDSALFSRFTYKFNLDSFDVDELYNRIISVLKNEGAVYKEEDVAEFVKKNYQKGLRDILNVLQISFITNKGNIVFEDLAGNTEIEENVLTLFLNMIKCVLKLNDSKQKKQCLFYPTNSIIAQDYTNFVTILNNNWDINYDQIYEDLVNRIDLYPAKNVVMDFHEHLESKKYPHLHFISTLYNVMKVCCEAQL